MDRHQKQWIAPMLATLIVSSSGGVVYADLDPFQSQLEALSRALDRAESTNTAVRFELEEARAHYSDQWLTHERADSIAELVRDVLADSDTRLNALGSGTMIGWSDGFYLASADGQFRLNISGYTQTRLIGGWVGRKPEGTPPARDYDKWRYGFEIPRTKVSFGGHAFGRGLEYYFETGWGRYDPSVFTANFHLMSFRLWDAWIKFRLTPDIGIKIGQFRLPFSRESLIQTQYQLAIERSLIDHRMGLGRTHGVELVWASEFRRFMLAVTNGSGALYHATIWQTQDPTPPWPGIGKDTLYSITMRHEWKILGDWDQFNQFTSPPGSERGILLGVAGHRQNTERDSTFPIGGFPDGVFWGVTGDISMQFDGASAFASIIYERVTDFSVATPKVNWLSLVAQGSTYITNQTELFARWESGGPNVDAFGGNNLMVLTTGFNHYLDGQDLKFSTDIGFSFGDVSRVMLNSQAGWQWDTHKTNQIVIRTQLQMMF